jgi:Methane oxygenase PmoA
MKKRILVPLLALAFAAGFCSVGAEAKSGFEIDTWQQPHALTLSWQGKKLLVYSFAPQKFKPYVQELRTIKGNNLLRDAPFDHLHHHALMYGIKVNGLNFWEETSGCGVEKVIETGKPAAGFGELNGQFVPQAKFSQVLHWVAPQDAFLPDSAPVALLIERRTLVLTVNPAQGEVALEWRSQFEVGARTNTVVLTGANYHGLGMRFLQELDPLAVHSMAGTRPDLGNNRQEVSSAPWAAVSFDAPGHPATIALAGHPANARGDATYFSMLTPFAYLSATQALDKEPLSYHTGDKFELNYLLLLYAEGQPSETLRTRIQSWRQAKRS